MIATLWRPVGAAASARCSVLGSEAAGRPASSHRAEHRAPSTEHCLLLALVLAGTLASLGCQRQEVEAKPLTLVQVQAVHSDTGEAGEIRYSGSVAPDTQVDVAFKVGGYIQEILRVRGASGRARLVQEGDRVRRGTVLAQVRQIDYTTRVAQARSQLEGSRANEAQARSKLVESMAAHDQAQSALTEARATKESAEAQSAEAQSSLGAAQAQLAQAQSGRRQAEAQLAGAEASREQAVLDFERAAALFAKESLTKTDYDAAKARRDSAQSQVDAAQQQIGTLQAQEDAARAQMAASQAKIEGARAQVRASQARIEQARGQLLQSHAVVTAAREQIAASRAGTLGSRAQLAQEGLSLADATLKAPMDGVLLARSVEIGSLVSAGSVGFVLADTKRVKIVFGVPDLQIVRLKLGHPITFTVEALPGARFPGRITAISAAADSKSRVFDVEVAIPNPGDRLKAGMIATLTLGSDARTAPIPLVPLSAVVRSPRNPKGYAVLVVAEDGGRPVARARDVTLGSAFGNRIAATAGVKEGDRVIVRGATLVKDGEPVQVSE